MRTSNFNGYKVNLVENSVDFQYMKDSLSLDTVVGLDVETSGLDFVNDTIAGVCISLGSAITKELYQGYYLPVDHLNYDNLPKDQVYEYVQYLLDNAKVFFFNRPYDFTMLEKEGVKVPFVGHTHDVQIMAHLVTGESFPALKACVKKYLKFETIDYSDNNAQNNNFKTTDPRISYIYAAGDPLITVLLGLKLWREYPYIRKIYPIDNKAGEAFRVFSNTTTLFLDKAIINRELASVNSKLAEIKNKIFSYVGYEFKLNSTRDKADALSRYVTLTRKTKKGQFEVGKEVLEKIDHPLAKMLLDYAKLEKYRGSYVDKMSKFPDEGFKINYSTVNVSTGRTSSGSSKNNSFFANFNIQNVPKQEVLRYLHKGGELGYYIDDNEEGAIGKMKVKGGLRDAFICPKGYVWLSADYSSEEMALMANFSGEPNLINPILGGNDIHNYIAKQMFGFEDPSHRTKVKILNFAVNYGGGAGTISNKLGCPREEAQALLDRYNSTLLSLTRWKQEQCKEARRRGMVFTYFGRPRILWPYYNSSDKSDWAFADRSAVNSPVQGTGGDLIRIDHVKLLTYFKEDPEFRENCLYACTVHDEINLFVKPSYLKKAYKILTEIMYFKPNNFKIPISPTPSVGTDWGHLMDCSDITDDNKIVLDSGKVLAL